MISYAARSYHQQQKSTPADSFRTAQPVSHLNLYVHALPPDSCALGACSFWASSFSRQPIPALPHRTIHNKLRPNLTIKLGTAGSKSSIICRATLKRNSKHHRPHSQFMRPVLFLNSSKKAYHPRRLFLVHLQALDSSLHWSLSLLCLTYFLVFSRRMKRRKENCKHGGAGSAGVPCK